MNHEGFLLLFTIKVIFWDNRQNINRTTSDHSIATTLSFQNLAIALQLRKEKSLFSGVYTEVFKGKGGHGGYKLLSKGSGEKIW